MDNIHYDFPWRITFETNPDTCNLGCIMCDTHSPYLSRRRGKLAMAKRILPFSIIEAVIRSGAKNGLREVIPSTMGEPLLYPAFDNLLNLIGELDLKLNLTTNGTFPEIGAKEWGKKILPVASDIKISINGATRQTAEKIMRGLDFQKQSQNVDDFLRLRDYYYNKERDNPTVTMQVTFMRSNLCELTAMLENAIELGFDRFKGHHVWVTNPNMVDESLKKPENRGSWNKIVDELKEIAGNKIKLANIESLHEPLYQKNGSICPFIGREAWIGVDGEFHVCCAPSEQRIVFGDFGNVNDLNILNIWKSQKYYDFVSNWGEYDLCQNCNMKIIQEDII